MACMLFLEKPLLFLHWFLRFSHSDLLFVVCSYVLLHGNHCFCCWLFWFIQWSQDFFVASYAFLTKAWVCCWFLCLFRWILCCSQIKLLNDLWFLCVFLIEPMSSRWFLCFVYSKANACYEFPMFFHIRANGFLVGSYALHNKTYAFCFFVFYSKANDLSLVPLPFAFKPIISMWSMWAFTLKPCFLMCSYASITKATAVSLVLMFF